MRAKTLVISASLLLLALTPLAAQDRDVSSSAGSGAFELAPVAPAPAAPAPVESEMQQESTQTEPLEPGDNAESSSAATAETSAIETQAVEAQAVESQTVETTTAPQVESQAVSELPSTASPLALVALLGLGSAGAAFGLRSSRRARR